MRTFSVASGILLVPLSLAFTAPPHGGVHTFHNGGVPVPGISPAPVVLPATVMRQSSAPLIAPPVSPFLGHRLGYYGGYGNYGYGYGFGLNGLGGYAGFGSFGSGYPYSNNPIQMNNYNVSFGQQPLLPLRPLNLLPLPSLPNDHPTTARLALQVPFGAEVWLQGQKVEMGTSRMFESPDLNPGEPFTFDLRVTWMENNKPTEEKRSLTMQPGDFQSLQFIAVAPAIKRLEK